MYLGKRLISLISSVLIASLIFTGCGSNLSQSVLSKGILTKEQKIYEVSDVQCSKCGTMMVYKEGRYGKFLACPNYPKCKNIQSINPLKVVGKCPKCGKNLYERKTKKGTNYYACEDSKECKFMSWDLPLNEECPKCGCYLLDRKTKFSEFKKCSNPDCDYFEKLPLAKTTEQTQDETTQQD